MSDTTADGTVAGKPQTARARELDVPPWMTLPAQDRYAAGMAIARGNREARAADAGQRAVQLARDLAARARDPYAVAEGERWNARGEARTRVTFGNPHPADFPGGLPAPREYPA